MKTVKFNTNVYPMTRNPYQPKPSHIVVQVIKSFFEKLRQNPDVYPIRYYKKNRKYRSNFNSNGVK